MRNLVRSNVRTVLRSNDQSRVLSSLIAAQPKYSFVIAKEWFGNHASSYSTKIGKALRSLETTGLIRPILVVVNLYNSPQKRRVKGYKLNLRSLVNAFCVHISYIEKWERKHPKQFTVEDKQTLGACIATETCKEFFKNHVIAKKLYGTSFKWKDSVFGALKACVLNTVFGEETRLLNEKVAHHFGEEDTHIYGRQEDEEIFKKAKEILGL